MEDLSWVYAERLKKMGMYTTGLLHAMHSWITLHYRAMMIEGIVTSLLADNNGDIAGVIYKDKQTGCSKVGDTPNSIITLARI